MSMNYCYACNRETETVLTKVEKTFRIKECPLSVTITQAECSVCHHEVFVEALETENDRLAFDAYRKKVGLLLPQEIKAIRESYGLSQTTFAKVMGLGEKTITRYENGSLQDMAYDNLLRMIQNPGNFLKIASLRLNELSDHEQKVLTQIQTRLTSHKGNDELHYSFSEPESQTKR